MNKNIVITGVSTGIGYHLTRVFITNGYRVFGSVRKSSVAQKLRDEFGESFHPLIFDVTDEKGITEAVNELQHMLGEQELSGLINNAGIAVGGPVMHTTTEDYRRQFEVNLFGVISLTRQLLPLLGAIKDNSRAKGRIINISSVSGKIGFPFLGPYCSSKFALEGFSEVLRRELLLYGIKVIVVAPGPVDTPIWQKSEVVSDKALESDFGPALRKFADQTKQSVKSSLKPERLAELTYQVFVSQNPKVRYTFHAHKFSNYIIPKYFISASRFDQFIKKMFFS